MIYTMVGSRETPKEILKVMEKFAYKAASKGYVVRSGAADGADTCAEEGVHCFIFDQSVPPLKESAKDLMEIYLPWKDFNGRRSDDYGYYTLPFLENKNQAYALGEQQHPAWDKCSNGAKSLHARNTMQVLGKDLNTPSRFILCYGKSEKEGSVIPKGGTRTACVLGQKHNVEIFNLYLSEHLDRVVKWLEK